MKNKFRYFISLALFITYPFLHSKAQLLDNKISVVAEYLPNLVFMGDQLIIADDFRYPSLFGNFKNTHGGALKVFNNFRSFSGLGIEYQFIHASEWKYADYEDFNGSDIVMHSLSPVIQFHNKFSESGIFNRIRIVIDVSPVFGISKITIVNPLFDIQGQNGIISQPMKKSDVFYGIKGRIGLELAISRLFGICFSYSVQNNWTNSKLYADDAFTYTNAGFGMVIRLKKDKRFYY